MQPDDDFLPIFRAPAALGLGLRSPNGVYGRARRDRDFPTIWKIRNRNFVRRSDLDAYRAKLARCGLIKKEMKK
ncbi:MAG TPA: hypothetical protein VIG36_13425 [Methylocystis sp.]|jgi:hypothetical protein